MWRPSRRVLLALLTPLLGLALATAATEPALGAPAAGVISHGTSGRHVVALTFDDAWDPGAARRIFAILSAADVPATFFPVATGVVADPALWRSIAVAGNVIGNHTVSHASLTTVDDLRLVGEIAGARTTIEQAIGRPMAPLLRPPNGAYDDRVLRAAGDLGFGTVVMWDVASADWTNPPPEVVAERSLTGGDGSIVLLHVGPESTIEALPAIIAGYRARGFSFVTVPELLDR
jgi:peptidoglycan/xylan/chitin deacetylase (PgdA/CDA1 family)